MYTKIILKSQQAKPFFYYHPWLYPQTVDKVIGKYKEGDTVAVHDNNNSFIAYGMIQKYKAPTFIKLYSYKEDIDINNDLFVKLVDKAIELRYQFFKDNLNTTNSFRLINSEGDYIPGLIVDMYNNVLVVQITASGVPAYKDVIIDEIKNKLKTLFRIKITDILLLENILGEEEKTPPFAYQGKLPDKDITIKENDILYSIDLLNSQKTGFYFDQRENRMWTRKNFEGKKVLDCFSYTGGFSLNIAKEHPDCEITAIESSHKAVEHFQKNIKLNKVKNITIETGDVFKHLKTQEDDTFDLIVLDPPKFVISHRNLDNGLKRYVYLNRLAMTKLKSGGMLVTGSCSGNVDITSFESVLLQSSYLSKRPAKIIHKSGLPCDHPIHINCFESHYLKFYVLKVF